MASQFDDILGGETPAAPPTQPIPFVTELSGSPSVYADGCVLATRLGSTVRLTMYEHLLEAADSASPGLKARHVGTLIMPIEGYVNMLQYLNQVTPMWITPSDTIDG